MYVGSDVALIRHSWLPGVDPHANPKLHSLSKVMGGQNPLGLDRCRDCVLGAREGIEQGVSLGVDLDPAVG